MSLEILRKDLTEKKPLLGVRRVTKLLASGTVRSLYVASNAPQKAFLVHLARTMEVPVEVLSLTSKELGTLCRKPYFVSVLCFVQ